MAAPMAKLGDKKFRYHYKTLSVNERLAYDKLLSSYLKLEKEITLPLLSSSSVSKILSALRRDIPELFYVDFRNDFKQFQWIEKWNKIVLNSSFLYTNTAIKLYKGQLKTAIQNFLDNHPFQNLSKFQKELMVHDYLASGTIYNTEDTDDVENSTIVAPLIMKCGVCEGYAKTFKLLCDRVGITSMIIFGDTVSTFSNSSGPHAWNMVKINGKCAHVDVTWDSSPSFPPTGILYDYFNISDSEISKNHIWERSEYPPCDSNDLNYYYYTKSVVANFDEFEQLVITRVSDQKLIFSVKFSFNVSSSELIKKRLNDLMVREYSIFTAIRYYSILFNEILLTAYIQFS
jgi:hypothetical protein